MGQLGEQNPGAGLNPGMAAPTAPTSGTIPGLGNMPFDPAMMSGAGQMGPAPQMPQQGFFQKLMSGLGGMAQGIGQGFPQQPPMQDPSQGGGQMGGQNPGMMHPQAMQQMAHFIQTLMHALHHQATPQDVQNTAGIMNNTPGIMNAEG